MQYELQILKNLLLKAYIILIKLTPPLKNFPDLNIAYITIISFYC